MAGVDTMVSVAYIMAGEVVLAGRVIMDTILGAGALHTTVTDTGVAIIPTL